MLVQEHPPMGATEPAIGPPGPTPVPVVEPQWHLGRTVLSAIALAVGLLAIVDLSGASIPAIGYIALPLAITGLGLIVGTWVGRARWLIVVGALLSIALGIGAMVDSADAKGDVSWRPASIQQLENRYHIDIGNAVLDLSAVSFTGEQKSIDVSVEAGNLTVILPPKVDVRLQAQVGIGNANVFGSTWDGIRQPVHNFSDEGVDGPGGGQLTIQAAVDVGNLEVRR